MGKNNSDSSCNHVCSEHSGIITSVKWLSTLIITGMTLILSAGTYFNLINRELVSTVNENIIEVNNAVAEVKSDILKLSHVVEDVADANDFSLSEHNERLLALEDEVFKD